MSILLQRIRRDPAILADAALLFMALAPALAWIEKAARGPTAFLWLHDAVFEIACFASVVAGVFLMLFFPVAFGAAFLFAYIHGRFRARSIAKRRAQPVRFGVRDGARGGLVFLLAWAALAASAFWWYLAAWQTLTAVIVGPIFAGAVIACFRGRKTSAIPRLLAFDAAAIAAVAIFILMDFYGAARVPFHRIFDEPAYDAQRFPDGTLIVLPAKSKNRWNAVMFDGPRRCELRNTDHPVRLTRDETTGDIYLANYQTMEKHQVSRVRGSDSEFIDLPPACHGAQDIKTHSGLRRVLIVCEGDTDFHNGVLHMMDMDSGRIRTIGEAPVAGYGLAVDETRERVYAVSCALSMRVTAVDARSGNRIGFRRVGLINYNAAADPATGEIWLARPISGELLVLNPDLEIISRVPAGFAPRDVEIDPMRGIAIVGNYGSGTVSVVDLMSRREIKRMRYAQWPGFRRLRGVSVEPDGSLLAADYQGLWEGRAESVGAAR